MNYYNSRYNFSVISSEGVAVYNTLSGALIRLNGDSSVMLADVLCGRKVFLSSEGLDRALINELVKGKFLITDSTEEINIIRQRYWHAREDTPVVLTITTTMDCNLGCYYCYEERSQKKLTKVQMPEILQVARNSLQRKNKKSLHVDWYGGEPLLNIAFLEEASFALQSLCQELGAVYHASVISNGTLWPDNLKCFIESHRIRQVQISLDGLRENHNKRRRYRKEYRISPDLSSFDQAINVIDELLHYTRVDIRLNLDRDNLADWEGILAMAQSRGWFDKPYPAVIQPARLASYTEQSSFMRQWELDMEDYDAVRRAIRLRLPANVMVEESEIPDGFPYPRTSVCAALSKDSVVIGAEGNLYRCGLQVGEKDREVGLLASGNTFIPLPMLQSKAVHVDSEWWERFDITELPSCSRCSFLPICWAGCPKKHLENDQHALDEQSKYWRMNLPEQIARRAGFTQVKYQPYSEADQFKEGW